MSRLSGGRIVAQALRSEGVSHLFTLCGGHIQSIYDGCLDEDIRVIDTRHEQTAAHAAEGWAKVTATPGVAAVTAGPGVTGAITAVAGAARAQVPMLLIGGQGARVLGPFGGQDRGSLQELNTVELLRPICKWAVSVPEVRRLGEYVHNAFAVARSGAPGPVFLDMPIDILMGGCKTSEVVPHQAMRQPPQPAAPTGTVEKVAELLVAARRPLLIVGSQWRWSTAPAGLDQLLDVAPMPTFLNGMARGALPADHPCLFRRCRSKALPLADCVVVCGTPLDFRLGYGSKIPKQARLVQLDLDAMQIGRNRRADVALAADTGHALGQLAAALQPRKPAFVDWMAQVKALETQAIAKTEAETRSEDVPINPLRLCAEINRFVDDKTIVVADGGDFVATAAYTLDIGRPGHWLDAGPLGTLGTGPGFAMAAKLARPDHRVLAVFGDGAFGFHAMEFEAMVRQQIPIVGIIGNDACWTQIHRGQVALYGPQRAVATTLSACRYDQVVSAMGGHGEYVERPADIAPAIERALASEKPALVNVRIGTSGFRKGAISV